MHHEDIQETITAGTLVMLIMEAKSEINNSDTGDSISFINTIDYKSNKASLKTRKYINTCTWIRAHHKRTYCTGIDFDLISILGFSKARLEIIAINIRRWFTNDEHLIVSYWADEPAHMGNYSRYITIEIASATPLGRAAYRFSAVGMV